MADITETLNWCIDKCNDDKVGYSQTYRQQQTVNGITYYDCSSFIWYGLIAGGFDVISANESSYPFTTQTMGVVLEKLGFVKYLSTSISWISGDIVWKNGHVEIVFIPDVTMGAHHSDCELQDQVSINEYPTDKSYYTYVYRYVGVPPKPTPSKHRKMPLWLMCRRF